MTPGFRWGSAAVCTLAVAVACGKQPASPSSPSTQPASPSSPSTTALASGALDAVTGANLKATAPAPVSPINGAKAPDNAEVTLLTNNATTSYATGIPLSYRFEIYSGTTRVYESALVPSGTGSTTSHTIDTNIQLEGDKTYTWRVRAEHEGNAGPWSASAAFIAPVIGGYIKGNELYDPLVNGRTIGTIHGPVTFIPNVGVRMDSDESWIEYELPQPLMEGEYSALVSGLTRISQTEDPKWRVLTMREGRSAMNDNDYRMSIDKRGNGAIAWRFISGDNRAGRYIETIGSERVTHRFQDHLTYLVRTSWFGNFFRAQYIEGGVEGTTVYDFGKRYGGVYAPSPHMVYVGSPWVAGDRGEPSTVDGMIVRQVWVSARPRPAFANK